MILPRAPLLSPKLVRRSGQIGKLPTYAHWCPGCNEMHDFAVEHSFHDGSRWSYDGNPVAPTFAPSMNIRRGPFPTGSSRAGQMEVCHYFLHGGRIQFLGDCTHVLRGQTVPLPDIPASAAERCWLAEQVPA